MNDHTKLCVPWGGHGIRSQVDQSVSMCKDSHIAMKWNPWAIDVEWVHRCEFKIVLA